jgi:hypothetical protein
MHGHGMFHQNMNTMNINTNVTASEAASIMMQNGMPFDSLLTTTTTTMPLDAMTSGADFSSWQVS